MIDLSRYRSILFTALRRCAGVALALTSVVYASPAEPGTQVSHGQEPKRVLLIYQGEMNLPAERAVDSGIRSVLGERFDIQLYSEHLDTSFFPDPKFQAAQLAWYRSKYRNRKIDLVIAVGLLLQAPFPDIPTVFCAFAPTGLPGKALSANSTAVWFSPDFNGTLAAAARLQPNARRVVVLAGTHAWDRHLEMSLRNTLSPNWRNWEFNYWDNMSVEEMRSKLANLPHDAIVLYLSIQRDGAGHSYVPRDLIPAFSAASSAPIYGLSDSFIGFGIVGGSVVSFETHGRQTAEIAQRILRGEKAADIPPVVSASAYEFDWRQLRRFGLSENALPPGSSVRFTILSPWRLYKRWIVGGLGFALLQTAFIVFLLAQRRRRRKAELLLGLELRFESFVASLSNTFANIPTEQTNAEIEKALEKLREFLDLDRVSLYEICKGDSRFLLSHSASLAGTPPGTKAFGRGDFPWLVANLLKGEDCVIRRIEDLPVDAKKEQALFAALNYRFAAFVPMRAAGETLGSLKFVSCREGMQPDIVVRQLKAVAEIFANALVRKLFEGGLGESQQRFQLMADAAPVMIWMSGTDKLCSFFNKRWLEFTGRNLDQELGNGWAEGVHPEDLQQCLKIYESNFDARLPFTMEYRLRRANGDYGWVFDTGVPRYTRAGEFMGYIGSCADITERRQAEQGMLDLSGRLIYAQEEERSRIARELHDDFSQRLALLAIQLGQVSHSLPNSDKAAIEHLQAMWERTTELSADIHKLSHQLHSSKLHHVGLLVAAKSLCEETGKQHGIQIEFSHLEMPEEIPPDAGLCLFRIVQEGLNNIVRHSDAKWAHVEFVGNGSHIRLRIVDAGVGFDPSSPKAQGGLGLASMRERLRLLGGSITLCSRPMEGTEIVVEVSLTQRRAHFA